MRLSRGKAGSVSHLSLTVIPGGAECLRLQNANNAVSSSLALLGTTLVVGIFETMADCSYFLKTTPPFITKLVRFKTLMSCSGSPGTAMMSAR